MLPSKLSDIAGQRKEFTKLSGDFVLVRDSFNRITAASQTSSAAGDLALMFNFMKMLDPGSVVRESEFATIAATGAFGERVKAAAETFLTGRRLTEEMRLDFVERADLLMTAQLRTQLQLEQTFNQLATSAGMSPGDVVIDFVGPLRSTIPGAQAALEPGVETPAEPPMKILDVDLEGNIIGGLQ